jgi:hypothetical protein
MALQCESCANSLTPPTCACGFDPTGSYLSECGSGGICQSDGSCECTDAALTGRLCDVCNTSPVSECRRHSQVHISVHSSMLHDNDPVLFAEVACSLKALIAPGCNCGLSSLCLNGGLCSTTGYCSCVAGYGGDRCEIAPASPLPAGKCAVDSDCLRGGTCNGPPLTVYGVCACPAPYAGEWPSVTASSSR